MIRLLDVLDVKIIPYSGILWNDDLLCQDYSFFPHLLPHLFCHMLLKFPRISDSPLFDPLSRNHFDLFQMGNGCFRKQLLSEYRSEVILPLVNVCMLSTVFHGNHTLLLMDSPLPPAVCFHSGGISGK